MAGTFKVPKRRPQYFKLAKSPEGKQPKEKKEKDWLKDSIESAARKHYKMVKFEDGTPENTTHVTLRDMTPEEKEAEDKRRAEFKAKMDERKAKKASESSHENNGHVEGEEQEQEASTEPETASV